MTGGTAMVQCASNSADGEVRITRCLVVGSDWIFTYISKQFDA